MSENAAPLDIAPQELVIPKVTKPRIRVRPTLDEHVEIVSHLKDGALWVQTKPQPRKEPSMSENTAPPAVTTKAVKPRVRVRPTLDEHIAIVGQLNRELGRLHGLHQESQTDLQVHRDQTEAALSQGRIDTLRYIGISALAGLVFGLGVGAALPF